MKKLVLVSLMFLFVLVGCTTMMPTGYIAPEVTKYRIPEVGIESSASIGDPIIKEGTETERNAVLLKKEYGTAGWTAYHPVGVYKLIGSNGGDQIFQFDESFSNGWGFVYPQIVEDSEGNVFLMTNSGKKPLPQNEYEKVKVDQEDSGDYQQTLIYTGSEGNNIKFTYREFIDDMARPAFTIDTTYDVSADSVIKFKNVSIQVIEFNNQEIKYKLLSGFQE